MERFLLQPDASFLNHGSFGALPASVASEQTRWRDEVERQPVHFLISRLPGLLNEARAEVAAFLGADPKNLAFVTNATMGVSAVLGSLQLSPGDELLMTNHGYNAVTQALRHVASRAGATVVVADVPFPLSSADEIVAAVAAALTPRTRLLLIDHITSPTALIFPVEALVALARSAGVPVLVDGAHVPGQLAVELESLGADWWTGNLHKWAFAPRGTAVLWVAPARQAETHAAVISHGYGQGLHAEFDWPGSFDPSAWLSAPAGLRAHARLGGPALMAANHARVRLGREEIAQRLGVPLPHPDDRSLYGAMASIPLPVAHPGDVPAAMALHDALWAQHRIEVPIMPWGAQTLVRISGQAYNTTEQYERLGDALRTLLR